MRGYQASCDKILLFFPRYIFGTVLFFSWQSLAFLTESFHNFSSKFHDLRLNIFYSFFQKASTIQLFAGLAMALYFEESNFCEKNFIMDPTFASSFNIVVFYNWARKKMHQLILGTFRVHYRIWKNQVTLLKTSL